MGSGKPGSAATVSSDQTVRGVMVTTGSSGFSDGRTGDLNASLTSSGGFNNTAGSSGGFGQTLPALTGLDAQMSNRQCLDLYPEERGPAERKSVMNTKRASI